MTNTTKEDLVTECFLSFKNETRALTKASRELLMQFIENKELVVIALPARHTLVVTGIVSYESQDEPHETQQEGAE
jgi:hypothetical protein